MVGAIFIIRLESRERNDVYRVQDTVYRAAAIAATESAGRFGVEMRAERCRMMPSDRRGAWDAVRERGVGGQNCEEDGTATENSNAIRILDATVSEAEVREMVGGTLPIVIDANANN
jgi:hypothetical protein